jgi:hypothetical protein
VPLPYRPTVSTSPAVKQLSPSEQRMANAAMSISACTALPIPQREYARIITELAVSPVPGTHDANTPGQTMTVDQFC